MTILQSPASLAEQIVSWWGMYRRVPAPEEVLTTILHWYKSNQVHYTRYFSP